MVWAYYNENCEYPATWLRRLIARKLIAPGYVDERSVVDVRPDDLDGFGQCHFFAGLGAWSLALRWAGWPDDRSVWTGSCPCQPFSSAGKGLGFADERHLFPYWHWLIEQRRPPVIFGEQVARAGEWLALVRSDLEALEYAVGCMPIEAASIGANHLRDRVWFVAESNDKSQYDGAEYAEMACASQSVADANALEHPAGMRCGGRPRGAQTTRRDLSVAIACSASSNLADADSQPLGRPAEPWTQYRHWLVEPGMGRVVDGAPARMDKLRALGNTIVPQVAATFIKAYLECR